jgi:hypothetical protein
MKNSIFNPAAAGLLILLAFGVAPIAANAQEKPAPVKSETFDMLIGTWDALPYQAMGSTWTDESTHYMKHNGQYMFIEINGKDDKGQTYTATIVIVPKTDGTFTGYGFDDWGGVSTLTGKADGNKIHVESKSTWGSETRDIEINGNTMTHKLSWTMKDKDGNDASDKLTITYKKK